MAKFSVNDILSPLSKRDALKNTSYFEIQNIPIEKILPSDKNIYEARDIDELAANIEEMGLLHNLVVKPENQNGYFEIISGERRYRACELLYENGNKNFGYLPCKIEAAGSALIDELKLIYANATARELTDYEKMRQAKRIKDLLCELKADGYEFKGRMSEIAAKIIGVSPAQVKRLNKIDKSLSDDFKQELRAENIGTTAAYEVANLPETKQKEAFDDYRKKGSLSLNDVKTKKEPETPPKSEKKTLNFKNKTEREEFIKNYTAWGVWRSVPELELSFYRYDFANGAVLIVTEYKDYGYIYNSSSNWRNNRQDFKTNHRYCLILSGDDNYIDDKYSTNYHKTYTLEGCGVSIVVDYMTKNKLIL